MIAYITVAPIASAFAERLPRKQVLISLDIVRANGFMFAFCHGTLAGLHPYFILQSLSGLYTTFQAMIPEVLPAEPDYTKAFIAFCAWPMIWKILSAHYWRA